MTTSNKDRLFTLIDDMSDEEQQDLIAELEERQSRDMRRYERQSSSVSVDYVAQDHSSQRPRPSGRALKKGNNSLAASIPTLPGGTLKGGGKGVIKDISVGGVLLETS